MTCDNPKVIHDAEILYKEPYSSEHSPGVRYAAAYALCVTCGWRRLFAGWTTDFKRELDAVRNAAAQHQALATPTGTTDEREEPPHGQY